MAAIMKFASNFIPKFDDRDFEMWKTQIHTCLEIEEVWDVVQNGIYEAPQLNATNDKKKKQANEEKADRKARVILYASLAEFKEALSKDTSAKKNKEVWEYLQTSYVETNIFKGSGN
eukprot:TRINITY_DN23532_c0_g1_i1.p1 TRINITY_DN23532_c0_g1~~TRINITY_DN23532_c0_g1_i1.p1  ORF type:complete len:117 (-),score=29.03 TRINITY_DN23532_c0_g1_i1:45-395(-)